MAKITFNFLRNAFFGALLGLSLPYAINQNESLNCDTDFCRAAAPLDPWNNISDAVKYANIVFETLPVANAGFGFTFEHQTIQVIVKDDIGMEIDDLAEICDMSTRDCQIRAELLKTITDTLIKLPRGIAEYLVNYLDGIFVNTRFISASKYNELHPDDPIEIGKEDWTDDYFYKQGVLPPSIEKPENASAYHSNPSRRIYLALAGTSNEASGNFYYYTPDKLANTLAHEIMHAVLNYDILAQLGRGFDPKNTTYTAAFNFVQHHKALEAFYANFERTYREEYEAAKNDPDHLLRLVDPYVLPGYERPLTGVTIKFTFQDTLREAMAEFGAMALLGKTDDIVYKVFPKTMALFPVLFKDYERTQFFDTPLIIRMGSEVIVLGTKRQYHLKVHAIPYKRPDLPQPAANDEDFESPEFPAAAPAP